MILQFLEFWRDMDALTRAEVAAEIEAKMKAMRLTRSALARRLGIEPSVVTRTLYLEIPPGPALLDFVGRERVVMFGKKSALSDLDDIS